MKKPHPIQFRAVHTKNRWRKADHETMANALGKTRGARALFDRLNRNISYSREGEPKYVIVWDERATQGEIVKPDHDQWDGLRHTPIEVVDIERFEAEGPPTDDELERYFLPRSSGRAAMPVQAAESPPEAIALPETLAELDFDLQRRIELALLLTDAERHTRLENAEPMPRRVEVRTSAFIRNADVIAEVLLRAKGMCEQCNGSAPFIRAKDGTPYLEVHHLLPLAAEGEDTVVNAIAMCPNCHRRSHFGRSEA